MAPRWVSGATAKKNIVARETQFPIQHPGFLQLAIAGVHIEFRRARGARSGADQKDRIGVPGQRALPALGQASFTERQQLFEAAPARPRRGADGDQRGATDGLAQYFPKGLLDHRGVIEAGNFTRTDQGRWFCRAGNGGYLVAPVAGVERIVDSAQFPDRQDRHHQFDRIRQLQADHAARADAEAVQSGGGPAHLSEKLGPAQAAPTLHDGHLIRRRLDVGAQCLGKGLGAPIALGVIVPEFGSAITGHETHGCSSIHRQTDADQEIAAHAGLHYSSVSKIIKAWEQANSQFPFPAPFPCVVTPSRAFDPASAEWFPQQYQLWQHRECRQ